MEPTEHDALDAYSQVVSGVAEMLLPVAAIGAAAAVPERPPARPSYSPAKGTCSPTRTWWARPTPVRPRSPTAASRPWRSSAGIRSRTSRSSGPTGRPRSRRSTATSTTSGSGPWSWPWATRWAWPAASPPGWSAARARAPRPHPQRHPHRRGRHPDRRSAEPGQLGRRPRRLPGPRHRHQHRGRRRRARARRADQRHLPADHLRAHARRPGTTRLPRTGDLAGSPASGLGGPGRTAPGAARRRGHRGQSGVVQRPPPRRPHPRGLGDAARRRARCSACCSRSRSGLGWRSPCCATAPWWTRSRSPPSSPTDAPGRGFCTIDPVRAIARSCVPGCLAVPMSPTPGQVVCLDRGEGVVHDG